MKVHFTLNGVPTEVEAGVDEMLLEVLRRDAGLTSVRETCGIGVCGACTALVNGRLISTCIYLAPMAEGAKIQTVDGLGGDESVQRAFVQAHAFQCGYCTPGMILTVRSLLEDNPHPTDDEIRVALGGNLCRCGCYVKIMDAVKIAAGPLTPGPSPSRGEGRVMRGSPGNTPPSRLEGYCTRKGDEE